MDQQQFDRRRAEDEARQDALLDQIHGGVVGLKNQAHAINGEVVEQNIMIDDIGNRMDNATQDISREEQAAREVNARKKKASVQVIWSDRGAGGDPYRRVHHPVAQLSCRSPVASRVHEGDVGPERSFLLLIPEIHPPTSAAIRLGIVHLIQRLHRRPEKLRKYLMLFNVTRLRDST
ncbi:unnamed protein product [Phytophthora fragariaefolia]|uniref:Unnamed protein product n=1 Tax=Phytophthora fragariaefolia TaxID=1490495 RepID=A0A9W6XT34_9STRA|nr:unnamed protein product [Phytophthora fragariaefolia]